VDQHTLWLIMFDVDAHAVALSSQTKINLNE